VPNGAVGEDPILDIIVHRVRVFSEVADRLVRHIMVLTTDKDVEQLRMDLGSVDPRDSHAVARLEVRLSELKSSLLERARRSGWDMDLLQTRMAEQD